MKFRLLTLGLSSILIISCKNDKDQETKETETLVEAQQYEEEETKIPVKMCYLYASATDTISLNIQKLDETISGSLIYMLKEKDINRGQISGKMKGDTLFAEYSFMSEGENSFRPVMFLQKDNQLIEGYLTEDSTSYKFNEDFALTRTNCGVN
ncbi:hypothetical protein SAMN04487907_102279 [Zunongwangia mangrovi]|uniref:NlpE N-terminal domain-containing protein n=1 Tax=Zunongwangia mangrovi TaxID=1334022 RepID=A0A1I1GIF7_9FLAO|nr:hypothetical protein [Zunongwangia mangrovi]SFC11052.1 hypothetical protein SAMN04487907_102279 [Zunongwangia mangrovi]